VSMILNALEESITNIIRDEVAKSRPFIVTTPAGYQYLCSHAENHGLSMSAAMSCSCCILIQEHPADTAESRADDRAIIKRELIDDLDNRYMSTSQVDRMIERAFENSEIVTKDDLTTYVHDDDLDDKVEQILDDTDKFIKFNEFDEVFAQKIDERVDLITSVDLEHYVRKDDHAAGLSIEELRQLMRDVFQEELASFLKTLSAVHNTQETRS